jgi:Zn finger protein HypA/HybF involved in hydrogenase expression
MKKLEQNKEQIKNNQLSSKKPGKRSCLSCGKKFLSEGAHHRICDHCKSLQGWTSGNPGFCSHRPDAANDNF